MNNKQIDQFYQFGKVWRATDKEMLKQRLDWYVKKQVDVQERIEAEKEKIPLDRADAKAEYSRIKD